MQDRITLIGKRVNDALGIITSLDHDTGILKVTAKNIIFTVPLVQFGLQSLTQYSRKGVEDCADHIISEVKRIVMDNWRNGVGHKALLLIDRDPKNSAVWNPINESWLGRDQVPHGSEVVTELQLQKDKELQRRVKFYKHQHDEREAFEESLEEKPEVVDVKLMQKLLDEFGGKNGNY